MTNLPVIIKISSRTSAVLRIEDFLPSCFLFRGFPVSWLQDAHLDCTGPKQDCHYRGKSLQSFPVMNPHWSSEQGILGRLKAEKKEFCLWIAEKHFTITVIWIPSYNEIFFLGITFLLSFVFLWAPPQEHTEKRPSSRKCKIKWWCQIAKPAHTQRSTTAIPTDMKTRGKSSDVQHQCRTQNSTMYSAWLPWLSS